jgi:hypothetical protein
VEIHSKWNTSQGHSAFSQMMLNFRHQSEKLNNNKKQMTMQGKPQHDKQLAILME